MPTTHLNKTKTPDRSKATLSRREALLATATVLADVACNKPVHAPEQDEPPYDGLGERVGEVTDRSAIIHTRLTRAPTRNGRGYSFSIWTHNLSREERQEIRVPQGIDVADLEGACPGREGLVRLLYSTEADLRQPKRTDWMQVSATTDFAHQFVVQDLQPATTYHYSVEMKAPGGQQVRRGEVGQFRTAPDADHWNHIKFAVITCQDYACRDDAKGFKTYLSMKRLAPAFLVSTGDNVYYDLDLPLATSQELARFHWHRMYSQASLVDFFRTTPGYWMQDDHDSFEDDDWPAREPQRVAPMTWNDLAPIFREQVPMGPKTYRRFRWGKGLEIWLVETREFRSPNSDVDGPAKSIWGAEQKEWLKQTLLASDADFRVLISPDCIVGPGAGGDDVNRAHFHLPEGGADSQGDGGFGYEGREFRHWVKDHKLTNLLVINGDRHWQYHSVDPETGINEFCCGAVTDSHSTHEDFDRRYHRYLRCKGGFITVSLEGTQENPLLAVRHHAVDGEVVHEASLKRGSTISR